MKQKFRIITGLAATVMVVIVVVIYVGLLDNASSNLSLKSIQFDKTYHLTAEKIPLHEQWSTSKIRLTKDYLLVTADAGDSVVYLYSLPDLQCKRKYWTRGQGPDDFQDLPALANTGNDYVFMRGQSPMHLRKYSFTETGAPILHGSYQFPLYEPQNDMHVIQDSILLYYMIDKFIVKKINLYQGVLQEEYQLDLKKESHGQSWFYSNKGRVRANDSLLIYVYNFKHQIDIYDCHTMQLKHRLTDGHTYTPPNPADDFLKVTSQYLYAELGQRFIYALYSGQSNDNIGASYTMEVFDFSGNPIAKYSFDISPYLFAIDEVRGYIYAYNPVYEDYLLKYKLPELM
ncbi:MAG: TolB-like 6-bladed beta-propeller domain-containing protein [Prevotellaceae bacterium]|jgi:hypothetical protein|nr:TolB-like 6-bladed beta-propeller domain-containing protein [Prevotellaceae bacterium]